MFLVFPLAHLQLIDRECYPIEAGEFFLGRIRVYSDRLRGRPETSRRLG